MISQGDEIVKYCLFFFFSFPLNDCSPVVWVRQFHMARKSTLSPIIVESGNMKCFWLKTNLYGANYKGRNIYL